MRKFFVTVTRACKVTPLFVMLLMVMAVCVQAVVGPADKSSLRILYVGTGPEKPLSELEQGGLFTDRKIELRKKRAADFEGLLNEYFEQVKVIYGEAFKEEMAADYDVTIIDTKLPAVVEEGGWITDPNTSEQKYIPPRYLTEQYDAATVMIGGPSGPIGEGRDLKIDYLCVCLDAHAHGMKLEHPIFHTPYKVDISLEERETQYLYHRGYTGRNLGDTMSVWRIQTEGYTEGTGFPPGLVSRGHGFDNGIDAEWISSGINGKNVEATAIGRHANFFFWGFSAAPEYMTDSAKLAFINSIHYISGFKGTKQVTRKIKGVELRPSLISKQWSASEEGRAAYSVYHDKKRQSILKKKADYQTKKDAGEELTVHEKMMLETVLVPPVNAPTPRFVEQLGGWDACWQYYVDNMSYFYPVLDGGYYKIVIDEDAKTLGIDNSDVQILDKAVAMLKAGEQVEVAQGFLMRYTKQSFDTADQWGNWLNQNRNNLYFSEGDGYKFIVVPHQHKSHKCGSCP